jgi:hypothetical protein
MPKALSFGSKDEIVDALKRRRWKDDLRTAYQKQGVDLGPLTAIYHSVSSSTYRAFRKHRNNSPSVVFRSWASEMLYHGAFKKLSEIRSNRGYRSWAFRVARDLDSEWSANLGDELGEPRALKLVNLLAKGLCIVSPLWPRQYQTIVRHLDVPLDQFSLRPLACIESLDSFNLRHASMGSIKTRKQYTEIQDAIRRLCAEARVPPIAYDLLMWDGAHPHGQL